MNRLVLVLIILALAVGGYILFVKSKEEITSQTEPTSATENQGAEKIEEIGLNQVKQASERFTSADSAFQAAKEAVKNYDLEFIESFTLPINCAWCDEFYEKVKNELLTANLSGEEKSFYAELLTVSGRVPNIEFVVQAYLNAKNDTEKEAYLNALELTVANEEIVDWLGANVTAQQDISLRDSLLSALTNQDSQKAIEFLYSHLIQQENPDADAQKGLGLSEAVPSDESLQFLIDKLKTSDPKYQRFVAASVLNNGLEGLKRFIDFLDTDAGKNLSQHFQSLADHVPFDDEIENYLKEVIQKGKEVQKVFAN
ncbi:MAG: hypothetical protein NZO16_04165, partial [Deltaproteobacteria bacterium]|nr:hypothetical protein [Deltaproteobacteria bacterium]